MCICARLCTHVCGNLVAYTMFSFWEDVRTYKKGGYILPFRKLEMTTLLNLMQLAMHVLPEKFR